ncbi:Uncharacterised protein [Vibrio cholerae]|nr:Uncharacterised protein [Vibrio cholerae]
MSPTLIAGAFVPITDFTTAFSSTPLPTNSNSMPSSRADISINSLTLYCTPVAITKSLGSSCCNIIHCILT